MDLSLKDAVTPCPSCKKLISIFVARCPNCGEAASASTVSFKRPDGSGGILDRAIVEYLRSSCSRPTQQDLSNLLAMSTKVEYLEELNGSPGHAGKKLTFVHGEEIDLLAKCISISSCDAHLLARGTRRLDFYRDDHRIAEIEIVMGQILRWSARWKNDAWIADAEPLANYFHARGASQLREEVDQLLMEQRREQDEEASWKSSWKSATPWSLSQLNINLLLDRRLEDCLSARRLLMAEFPATEDQTLALLAWYGHGGGPWSGYRAIEGVPEMLLDTYDVAEVIAAIESRPLTLQQMEGAARYVGQFNHPRYRDTRKKWIDRLRTSSICKQLVDFVHSGRDDDKTYRLNQVLGET